MKPPALATVEEYLDSVDSDEKRAFLERIRKIVGEIAPEAEEVISYGMPTFKLNGHLVSYAAFANHCSLFPGGMVPELGELVTGFKTSKGTIQFPLSEPFPDAVIRAVVQLRTDQNRAKKKK